jgi:hypothetical protein
LPDGIFTNQKYQFGYSLEGLGMENVCDCRAIWYINTHFGKFLGPSAYFVDFEKWLSRQCFRIKSVKIAEKRDHIASSYYN